MTGEADISTVGADAACELDVAVWKLAAITG
jgi:hypothetical protein